MQKQWPIVRHVKLDLGSVGLSAPVPLWRKQEHFWYPQVLHFADGTLAMLIRVGGDVLAEDDALVSWSSDSGATWGPFTRYTGQSTGQLPLADDQFLLLPFHLYRAPEGMHGRGNVITGQGELLPPRTVTVTGWSRADRVDTPVHPAHDVETSRKLNRSGFYFDAHPLRSRDGCWLAPLYGTFEGAQRYSTALAESNDGLAWRIRSVVSDDNCPLSGSEGPCEATLCRLKDGRLMCVFRMGGVPRPQLWASYGQCFSSDEGRTWTKPESMGQIRSAEPRLLTLGGGQVVLAGGRPDLYLWINVEGDGKKWQAVDLLEHHNACLKAEPVLRNDLQHGAYGRGRSSSYISIAATGPSSFLVTYDRTPLTFPNPPKTDDPRETYGVYLLHVTLE